MTTYSYKITLNDSEYIAIESALRFYIDTHVQSIFEKNKDLEFVNHYHKIKEILDTNKLDGESELTSTSSFVWGVQTKK